MLCDFALQAYETYGKSSGAAGSPGRQRGLLVTYDLRPGAVPKLLLPLFGILRGRRYTYQWAPMLVLAYFVEGVMRGYADGGASAAAGWSQAALAIVFIAAAAYYARDAHRIG